MDLSVSLALFSAILAAALALAVAWYERRSIAHWSFVAGMAVLAVESVFAGLTGDAVRPDEIADWQNWRLVAMSFLPGIWLFSSLSFARGNYPEFLKGWRFCLLGAFLIPVGLAIAFRGHFFATVQTRAPGALVTLSLGLPG